MQIKFRQQISCLQSNALLVTVGFFLTAYRNISFNQIVANTQRNNKIKDYKQTVDDVLRRNCIRGVILGHNILISRNVMERDTSVS